MKTCTYFLVLLSCATLYPAEGGVGVEFVNDHEFEPSNDQERPYHTLQKMGHVAFESVVQAAHERAEILKQQVEHAKDHYEFGQVTKHFVSKALGKSTAEQKLSEQQEAQLEAAKKHVTVRINQPAQPTRAQEAAQQEVTDQALIETLLSKVKSIIAGIRSYNEVSPALEEASKLSSLALTLNEKVMLESSSKESVDLYTEVMTLQRALSDFRNLDTLRKSYRGAVYSNNAAVRTFLSSWWSTDLSTFNTQESKLARDLFIETPGFPELQNKMQQMAFKLMVPILAVKYPKQRAAIDAFETAYSAYLKNTDDAGLRQQARNSLTAISQGVAAKTPQAPTGTTSASMPPLVTAPTAEKIVLTLDTISDLLKSGESAEALKKAVAEQVQRLQPSSVALNLISVLQKPGSLALDSTLLLAKGKPGTVTAAYTDLSDAVENFGGEVVDSRGGDPETYTITPDTIRQRIYNLEQVSATAVAQLQLLFAKEGIAEALQPALTTYSGAIAQAESQVTHLTSSDPKAAAQLLIRAVTKAKEDFLVSYKAAITQPEVEALLWKNRMQQAVDAQLQKVLPQEQPESSLVKPEKVTPDPTTEGQNPGVEKTPTAVELKLQADAKQIDEEFTPMTQSAQAIQEQLRNFETLLKTAPVTDATVKQALAQYQQLNTAVDQFPLVFGQDLERVSKEFTDPALIPQIGTYARLFHRTTSALLPQAWSLADLLQESYYAFSDVQATLAHDIPLTLATVEKLQKYQTIQLQGFDKLSNYLNTKATEELTELREKNLLPRSMNVNPMQPRLEPVDFDLQQAKDKLEEVGARISDEHSDFKSVILRINRLTGQDSSSKQSLISLEESDLKTLAQDYADFITIPRKIIEYTKQIDTISGGPLADVPLAAEKRALALELDQMSADYAQQLRALKEYRLNDLANVLKVFDQAGSAQALPVENNPPLIQRAGTALSSAASWVKNKLTRTPQPQPRSALPPTPEVPVEQLAKLLFWDSSSDRLQTAVREQADAYLRQVGSPTTIQMATLAERLKPLEQQLSDSLENEKGSDTTVVVRNLEQLREEVKNSGLPSYFITELRERTTVDINRLKATTFSPQDLQEQINTLQESLVKALSAVTDKSSVEGIHQKTRETLKTIDNDLHMLSLYAPQAARDAHFSKDLAKLSDQWNELRAFVDNSPVWQALSDLEQITYELSGSGKALKTGLAAAGKTVGTQDAIKNVLGLLFFKEPLFETLQQTIRDKALAGINLLAEQPDQKQAVLNQVASDYTTFTTYETQLNSLLSSTEHNAQQITELRDTIDTFIADRKGEYAHDGSEYVDFRNRLLRALAEQRTVLANRLDALSQPETGEAVTVSPVGAEEIAQEEATQDEFFDAVPLSPEEQAAVTRARAVLAAISDTAAQLAAHDLTIDSIGIAEKLLAAVDAFRAGIPETLLLSAPELTEAVEKITLLLNHAMTSQKLALVASLKRAYESLGNVVPTGRLRAALLTLLTPSLQRNVGPDSAFGRFLSSLASLVQGVTPATKQSVLDAIQKEYAQIENRTALYQHELSPLLDKNSSSYDADIADAFKNYPKNSESAAIEVLIRKLDVSYRVMVFKNLSDDQVMALKQQNEKLYLTLQADTVQEKLRTYLLSTYKLDLDKLDTQLPFQKEELEKAQAVADAFLAQLRASSDVTLAFQLYNKLQPLLEKLKEVDDLFKAVDSRLVKKNTPLMFKVRYQLRGGGLKLSRILGQFFGRGRRIAITAPVSREVEQFEADPAAFLARQVSVKTAAEYAQLKEQVATLEQQVKALKEKGVQGNQAELATYQEQFKRLQQESQRYEDIRDTYVVLSTPDGELAFEKGPDGTTLTNKQVIEFIAQALSDKGSLYIPPSAVLDAQRELLQKRLNASGKTTGEGKVAAYRDLGHVLKNDYVWAYEVRKLARNPLKLDRKALQKGLEALLEEYPERSVDADLRSIALDLKDSEVQVATSSSGELQTAS